MQFIYNSIRTRSPRRAWTEILKSQFPSQNTSNSSLSELRKNSAFRILLFLFGAAPQAIKLYSIRGIIWTQLWCTIYLWEFTLLELLPHLSEHEEITPSTEEQAIEIMADSPNRIFPRLSYVEIFAATSFCLSLPLPFYAFTRALFTLLDRTIGPLEWLYVIAIWIFISITWPTQIVMSFLLRNSRYTAPLSMGLFLITAPLAAMMSGLNFTFGKELERIANSETGFFVIVGVTVCLAIFVTLVSFLQLSAKIFPTTSEVIKLGFGTYFALMHLAAAGMYYFVHYTPENTRKPWWTEFLG